MHGIILVQAVHASCIPRIDKAIHLSRAGETAFSCGICPSMSISIKITGLIRPGITWMGSVAPGYYIHHRIPSQNPRFLAARGPHLQYFYSAVSLLQPIASHPSRRRRGGAAAQRRLTRTAQRSHLLQLPRLPASTALIRPCRAHRTCAGRTCHGLPTRGRYRGAAGAAASGPISLLYAQGGFG